MPHLDYDLQRFGPRRPQAAAAAAELDAVLAPLLDDAARRGRDGRRAVSEYGITEVDRPVHVNRVLREAGLLEVHTQAGMEYLDPWTSRGVRGRRPPGRPRLRQRPAPTSSAVRDAAAGLPGVEQVLDARRPGARHGLDHDAQRRARRSSPSPTPGSRTTTGSTTPARRTSPAASRSTASPGYDPAELFFDPADRRAKAEPGSALVRKKLGLRYAMSVVPLDARWVKGTHGRLPDDPADAPVLITSTPGRLRESVAATEVRDLVLQASGVVASVNP